jgi:hypothetical protein
MITLSTIVMIVSLVATLSMLLVNIATLKKLNAPQPPNAELNIILTRHEAEIVENARRIAEITAARVECHRTHMAEIGNLYKRINTTAETLAQTVGQLQTMLRTKGH